MIEGLKPYAEYKESGLPWLGSVPAHWEVEVRNAAYSAAQGAEHGSQDKHVAFTELRRHRSDIVDPRKDGPEACTRPINVIRRRQLSVGALILMNDTMESWRVVGIAPCDGIISSGLRRLHSDTPDHSLFAQHYVASKLYVVDFDAGIRRRFGLRQDLTILANSGRFQSVHPPDEQAAIVRFLDHANRKIDGFIRAKRKLIGLLNEQKQAIIHRAVTRGLNPDVPLKPSGIPWLGDIPAHWEVLRAKYLFREDR